MGKGLDNVNSFVRKNKSSWKLYSGSVLLNGYPNGNKYSEHLIYGFKGTVVQVNINLQNLPPKELVINFDWDF